MDELQFIALAIKLIMILKFRLFRRKKNNSL